MIKKNILAKFWLIPILLLALFLRFYNLENTAMFLGDQGRDAIIVKRILTLENLPAIGPPSSIGQVYLGPFYYYLIAPFLLLFRFNPVGLAAAVGFYSLVLSFAIYYFSKDLLEKKLRIALLFFMLFSPTLLEFSRFSWNPNLLPYFTFLTTIFFAKAVKEKSLKYSALFGSFAALSLQLHYAFLFILPLYAGFLLYFSYSKGWKLKKFLKLVLTASFPFAFFLSPLVIFDLRHNFLNLKNFLKLLQETKPADFSFWKNFLIITSKSLDFALQTKIFEEKAILSLIFFIAVLGLNYKKIKRNLLFTLSFFQILVLFFAIAFFNFRAIPHYFGIFYLPFYIFLASFLLKIGKEKVFYLLLAAIFGLWFVQYKRILATPQTPQIPYAREVAKKILLLIKKEKEYQLIALPPWESTKPFRYFLEIWGKRPLEEESSKIPDALIVVCFENCPDPITNPQWQIAAFPNKKIDKIVKFKNLKIVKIVNEKKSEHINNYSML